MIRQQIIELLENMVSRQELLIYGEVPVSTSRIADHLIANGVTVQRWIPVTERLPEESGYYLVCTKNITGAVLSYSSRHKAFNAIDGVPNDFEIACLYWMPVPNLPGLEQWDECEN